MPCENDNNVIEFEHILDLTLYHVNLLTDKPYNIALKSNLTK